MSEPEVRAGKRILRSDILLPGLLLLVVLVVIFALYFNFSFSFGKDQAIPVYQFQSTIDSGLYAWQQMEYTGMAGILSGLPVFALSLFNLALYSLFGIKIAFILDATFYWIGALGLYLLLNELFAWRKSKALKAIFFMISILFIMNFGFTRASLTLEPGMIFLPYLLLFAYRTARACNLVGSGVPTASRYSDASLLSLSLAAVIMFNLGSIIQTTIFFALMALAFLLLSGGAKIAKLKCYLFSLVLAIAMSTPAIASSYLLLYRSGQASYIFGQASQNILAQNSLGIFQSIFGFISDMVSNIVSLAVGSLFIIVSAAGTYLLFTNKNQRNNGLKPVFVGLWSSYIVLIFLGSAFNGPFGALFSLMLKAFNQLSVLRYPSTNLHYLFVFMIFTLFGISLALLHNHIYDTKKKHLRYLFSAFCLVIFVSYIFQFLYVPYVNSSSQTGPNSLFNVQHIPAYVLNISNYINSQPGNFSVAVLPMAASWQSTTWYVGVNVYASLLEHPTYTGAWTVYNEVFFPVSAYEYWAAGQELSTSNTTSIDFSRILGTFGIKYIIVQGDAVNYPYLGVCCKTAQFTFNTIYRNINNSSGMVLVRRFNNSSVYENLNAVPLVYASNLQNIGNAQYQSIMSVIGSKGFDIRNISVYSEQSIGLFNSTRKIVARNITGFAEPSMSFKIDTPTKTTVNIRNATAPFYLVFRETYDPGWEAFYANGTRIDSAYHIQVNGFANAWYVNKTGSYSITIYYTPQTTGWGSMLISIAAFAAAAWIVYLGFGKHRAPRRPNKRIR